MASKSVRRYFRKPKPQLSVAVAMGFVPLFVQAWNDYKSRDFAYALKHMGRRMTGYNPDTRTWSFANLKEGLMPIMIGGAVHVAANYAGINKGLKMLPLPVKITI